MNRVHALLLALVVAAPARAAVVLPPGRPRALPLEVVQLSALAARIDGLPPSATALGALVPSAGVAPAPVLPKAYTVLRGGKPHVTVSARAAEAAREVLAGVSPRELAEMPAERLEDLGRRLIEKLAGAGELSAVAGAPEPVLARVRRELTPVPPRRRDGEGGALPPAPPSRPPDRTPWHPYASARNLGALALAAIFATGASAWQSFGGGWELTLSAGALAGLAAWLIGGLVSDERAFRRIVKGRPDEAKARGVVSSQANAVGLAVIVLAAPVVGFILNQIGLLASMNMISGDRGRFLVLGLLAAGGASLVTAYQFKRVGARPISSWRRLGASVLAATAAAALIIGEAPRRLPLFVFTGLDAQDRAALSHPARPPAESLSSLPSVVTPSARPWSDPAVAEASARGAAYLLKSQRGGKWSVGAGVDSPTWDGLHERTAITALAAEALELAASGPDAEAAVAAARDFVLAHMLKDRGELALERRVIGGNNDFPYVLAFGLEGLLRAHARATGTDKDAYAAAVRKTLEWISFSDLRYGAGDDSRATFQLALVAHALADARDAGFELPAHRSIRDGETALDALTAALQTARRVDGGGVYYPYMLGGREDLKDAMPRSALIESVLFRAGRSDPQLLSSAVDQFILSLPAMERVLGKPGLRTHDRSNHSYAKYYYHLDLYYAAKALSLLDGPAVKERAAVLKSALLARQDANGSWCDSAQACGPAYGTAMAIRTLRILQGVLDRP